MSASKPQSRRVLHQRTAARTALFYSIFSCLWIYFSDTVLAWFLIDPIQLTQAQTIKGGLFVVVTAVLLYLYLSHCLQRMSEKEEELEAERDKIQQQMQDHIHQLNILFDSMNAVIYVADLETYELIYVNRFALDFFGPDWQKRKCYHYLQNNRDQPCEFCTNSQLLNEGQHGDPVVWEFFNPKTDRWYECFDKAIRWTDGRLVRLEVAQDVTERKQLEKIKDDLLSAMSHEMRTPLTAISGFAELLEGEEEIPEQHRRHINIICREAEKLTELINRFLDIKRLKTDRARVDYEHLSVRELLAKLQTNTRDCKKHHIIKVICRTDAQIYGHRKELTQVLTQLLENACRYSPQGGDIELTAQSDERGVSICVTDQGIGIPAHELKSIFSPFHRLDTGDTRTTGGVGLGLYLAREIIILHGGTIKVSSNLGEGSTFTVLLPCITDQESRQETPKTIAEYS